MKQFHLMPFIGGVVFGFVLLYYYQDQKIKVTQYPKVNDTQEYKDSNGNTYIYETKEVPCNEHEKNLEMYPIA
jgi:hypothetical protein